MACTSSSTSVAVSRRPSSRAPACAAFAEMANNADKNSVEAKCILIDIKTPNLVYHAIVAGQTPSRPDSSPSLPLVRRRENPRRIGIAMMRAIVLDKPYGCLLCCGVLWTHRPQQLGAGFHKHRFSLGSVVALDQSPAQARLAAR